MDSCTGSEQFWQHDTNNESSCLSFASLKVVNNMDWFKVFQEWPASLFRASTDVDAASCQTSTILAYVLLGVSDCLLMCFCVYSWLSVFANSLPTKIADCDCLAACLMSEPSEFSSAVRPAVPIFEVAFKNCMWWPLPADMSQQMYANYRNDEDVCYTWDWGNSRYGS